MEAGVSTSRRGGNPLAQFRCTYTVIKRIYINRVLMKIGETLLGQDQKMALQQAKNKPVDRPSGLGWRARGYINLAIAYAGC